MRIFTRYVLKEVLSHALLGVALFTFIIFMRDVSRILELVVRNSAPVPSVAEIFFLTLPTAFTFTIPMGVLVGILIGLSRLASDSEVTAMRACGIGSFAFVRIIFIFALAAWLVAMLNSIIVAPRSARALNDLQNSLKTSQASFEVQPRVFYEDLPNYVLYVQDVHAGQGAAAWDNVFLADISNPSAPKITLAQHAIVTNEDQNALRLHLVNGSQHETMPRSPDQYNITSFAETDIPIALPTPEPSQPQDKRTATAAQMTTSELLQRGHSGDASSARWYMIEFHRRLALPTSCLVLALVGIPLGLSSRKGGKSTGFVLTIILVFVYYFVSLAGVAMARQGKLSPEIGVWIANIVFAAAGFLLLYRVDHASLEIGSVRDLVKGLASRVEALLERTPSAERAYARSMRARSGRSRFPLILDNYILRTFTGYLLMVLSAFILLMLVFTFFELLGDIVRNRVALVTVGDYLLNVTPSIVYLMTPLAVLVAVLVTFGLMTKSNEITAMKATGISIYRAVVPVLVITLFIAISLFFFEQLYLPTANTRQEALRNSIKGKPAQTFLRPDRKWIFGSNDTIYYYEHLDTYSNEFFNLSVFRFDPKTFEIRDRIFARRAHWEGSLDKWVLENGWERQFEGQVVTQYNPIEASTFAWVNDPPTYFNKEEKQSSEMNYVELKHYIQDLQQSGFDVVRLKVQLYKKFAFPLITFVMAVLAIPFSFSQGRRGALTGVAVAIALAMVYWVTSGLFEAMGNVSQLPAMLAAWAPDLLFGLAGGYMIFKVQT